MWSMAKQRTDIVKLNVSKDIEPQEHACMEPVSAIGMVQDGKTILYSCTQAPFEIRSMLAKDSGQAGGGYPRYRDAARRRFWQKV